MTKAETKILHLIAARGPDKTVCPSEVARLIASAPDWRPHMAEVHRAVDILVREGAVRLSWKGQILPRREGPYRIGLPE